MFSIYEVDDFKCRLKQAFVNNNNLLVKGLSIKKINDNYWLALDVKYHDKITGKDFHTLLSSRDTFNDDVEEFIEKIIDNIYISQILDILKKKFTRLFGNHSLFDVGYDFKVEVIDSWLVIKLYYKGFLLDEVSCRVVSLRHSYKTIIPALVKKFRSAIVKAEGIILSDSNQEEEDEEEEVCIDAEK